MAATIFEWFSFRHDDTSQTSTQTAITQHCPFLNTPCIKTFADGTISGVCSIKPITSSPVICCPNRLYAGQYAFLRDITKQAFNTTFDLIAGDRVMQYAKSKRKSCLAVFGKGWGSEIHIPKKQGRGHYFVDWVVAKINPNLQLEEFIAIEVQSIDTTGSYRHGFDALQQDRKTLKTRAGLNYENVSKRILPQLIYKGQVLQRETLCKQGLFFLCPKPVYQKIMERLGGKEKLVSYTPQPAAITFVVYDYVLDAYKQGESVPLEIVATHTTTVYKLQEAFNNVTLPDGEVFRAAINKAIGNADSAEP